MLPAGHARREDGLCNPNEYLQVRAQETITTSGLPRRNGSIRGWAARRPAHWHDPCKPCLSGQSRNALETSRQPWSMVSEYGRELDQVVHRARAAVLLECGPGDGLGTAWSGRPMMSRQRAAVVDGRVDLGGAAQRPAGHS